MYTYLAMCNLCHGLGICGLSSQTLLSGWKCSGDIPDTTNVCAGPSTSEWSGVGCSGGNVSFLSLTISVRSGTISSSIGSLSYLERLNIEQTNLMGMKCLLIYIGIAI